MSNRSKLLKVMSVLLLLEGIFTLISAIVTFMNMNNLSAQLVESGEESSIVTVTLAIIGVLSIVMAALYILSGYWGLKSDSTKRMKVVGIILLVLAVISLISSISSSDMMTLISDIAGVIVMALYLLGVKQSA